MLSDAIIRQLSHIVGEENIKQDKASLLAYSYDSTAQYQALPEVILSPRNTA